jgi:hypothetical protein
MAAGNSSQALALAATDRHAGLPAGIQARFGFLRITREKLVGNAGRQEVCILGQALRLRERQPERSPYKFFSTHAQAR